MTPLSRKRSTRSVTTNAFLSFLFLGVALLLVALFTKAGVSSSDLAWAGGICLILAAFSILSKPAADRPTTLNSKDRFQQELLDIGVAPAVVASEPGQHVRMPGIFNRLQKIELYSKLIQNSEGSIDDVPEKPPGSGGRSLYWYEYDCALCYAREDAEMATVFKEKLMAEGVESNYIFDYLDPKQNVATAGTPIKVLRDRVIGNSARFVVALVSTGFAASGECRRELGILRKRTLRESDNHMGRSHSVLKLIPVDDRGHDVIQEMFPGVAIVQQGDDFLDQLVRNIAAEVPHSNSKG